MNCANHPQNPVAAYCRTCGKPLCKECTRSVAGVIYCENCLAERVAGTAPPASTFQPAPGYTSTPPRAPVGSGPHPGIAGILAGIFPGVGSVYCGLYAKGLAQFLIFIFLIAAASNIHGDVAQAILILSTIGFYLYQIVDAVKSAKALQTGQPAPDPFGLGTMFSPGERVSFSKGVPTGAVVLIGLGVLFLLHNLGIWFLEVDRIWPVFLIALGVWLFVKRRAYGHPLREYRSITGPAILVTIGVLSLLDNLHGPGWDRTWPVILLVIGVIKLMERGYLGGGPPTGASPGSEFPPAQQPPTEVNSEVKNG